MSLRMRGESYAAICRSLGIHVAKSSMWYWFKDLELSASVSEKMMIDNLARLARGRETARHNSDARRREYMSMLEHDNRHLVTKMDDADVAKIVLAVLFLGEGSKKNKGSLTFCNADPYVIGLFLHLLRTCYKLSEEKFRCTVQCRADQDIPHLQAYWSSITAIPLGQFSKAQVDRRTVGKPTIKKDYKGVCRLEYYSAHVYHELSYVSRAIFKGH